MTPQRLMSISMACTQASGGYPPEIVNEKGEFDASSLKMEANSMGDITGRFKKKKRGGEILRPIGSWPENWLDEVHELDGPGVDSSPADR